MQRGYRICEPFLWGGGGGGNYFKIVSFHSRKLIYTSNFSTEIKIFLDSHQRITPKTYIDKRYDSCRLHVA